jgi:geranyl-CoA carboxylase alpha subunit
MTRATPFSTLLVANRGEIAVRVLRSARALGYRTVAVHSDADAGAPHVAMADQAVCIGGAAPGDSYLRIDRIIDAARRTGADAIHPGYGFLAENPGLPAACAEAGIVFVGPSADSIARMGDKAGAKALMIAAGVPCVPGWQGADQSEATLTAEAARIGYPLMIKATAGGGGRGMRLVEDPGDFATALSAAKSEAKSAFGSDTVLLERAIIAPRHLEIQILVDRFGAAVHLAERDCSVQRRHQKLIEEAPSPAVSPDLRARMGAVSVQAALAIGYEGAGTFEYLLDADGAFYFMEMNTRLQVEHPVTEAITGLDLVALQLKIASGAPLGLVQSDIVLRGHAIEVRLCAEDPGAGFLPQSGRMAVWRPAQTLRVDHGLADGADIPPHYDSMIAKLIAHGDTRGDALRMLATGLADTVALGVRTNQAFLAACLAHPEFVAGLATTAFIARHHADLAPSAAEERRAAMLTAAVLRASPSTALAHGHGVPVRLTRGPAVYDVRVIAHAHGVCEATCGDEAMSLTVGPGRDGVCAVTMGGRVRALRLARDGDTILTHIDGVGWDFADRSLSPRSAAAAPGVDGKVRASMNGTVVSVDVAVGDAVVAGQKLLSLEAMKMEHIHAAPVAGVVAAVHAAPGAQVAAQALLAEVTPAEA